jgi:general secretion pathway protein G
VKLRCPYCRKTFEALARAVCPHCGKGLRGTWEPEGSDGGAKPAWRSMRYGPLRVRRTLGGAAVPNSPFMIFWLLGTYRSRVFMWVLILSTVIAARMLFTKVTPAQVHGPDHTAQTQQELRTLRTALEWFRADCQRYPTDDEGLKALVQDPGVPGWHGYYIDKLAPDVWGRPYRYACATGAVALGSLGADGLAGSADDIAAPAPDWRALADRIPVSAFPRCPTNAAGD